MTNEAWYTNVITTTSCHIEIIMFCTNIKIERILERNPIDPTLAYHVLFALFYFILFQNSVEGFYINNALVFTTRNSKQPSENECLIFTEKPTTLHLLF